MIEQTIASEHKDTQPAAARLNSGAGVYGQHVGHGRQTDRLERYIAKGTRYIDAPAQPLVVDVAAGRRDARMLRGHNGLVPQRQLAHSGHQQALLLLTRYRSRRRRRVIDRDVSRASTSVAAHRRTGTADAPAASVRRGDAEPASRIRGSRTSATNDDSGATASDNAARTTGTDGAADGGGSGGLFERTSPLIVNKTARQSPTLDTNKVSPHSNTNTAAAPLVHPAASARESTALSVSAYARTIARCTRLSVDGAKLPLGADGKHVSVGEVMAARAGDSRGSVRDDSGVW